MRIGIVAKEAGVGVETMRFYERRSLIRQPPKPSAGGFRSYPPEVVERIRFIRHAQALGFSLKQIGDIRRRAQSRLIDADKKIADLKAIRQSLRRLVDACPGEGSIGDRSSLENLRASTSVNKSARAKGK